MTEKEKAIEWLKACKETNYGHSATIQGYMDMAISALSDYDKLMTINQQLAFENEELRENIEKIKEEIGDKYANTHHMYPNYAGGLSYAYGIIDKYIGKEESEEKPNE